MCTNVYFYFILRPSLGPVVYCTGSHTIRTYCVQLVHSGPFIPLWYPTSTMFPRSNWCAVHCVHPVFTECSVILYCRLFQGGLSQDPADNVSHLCMFDQIHRMRSPGCSRPAKPKLYTASAPSPVVPAATPRSSNVAIPNSYPYVSPGYGVRVCAKWVGWTRGRVTSLFRRRVECSVAVQTRQWQQ